MNICHFCPMYVFFFSFIFSCFHQHGKPPAIILPIHLAFLVPMKLFAMLSITEDYELCHSFQVKSLLMFEKKKKKLMLHISRLARSLLKGLLQP